jgi:hypothetical protein
LFASSYGRVFGSVDDGVSWTQIAGNGKLHAVEELVVAESEPDAVLIVTRGQGIYRLPLKAAFPAWAETAKRAR